MYVGQVRRMHEGFCSIIAWFKTKARTYVGFSVEITYRHPLQMQKSKCVLQQSSNICGHICRRKLTTVLSFYA